MKNLVFGGTILLLVGTIIYFLATGNEEIAVTLKKERIRKPEVNFMESRRSVEPASRLSFKTGIPETRMNECVLDILSAFEAGDKDLIREKVLEWLAKDEQLFLASITAFDNLDQIYGYGFDLPSKLISEVLYEKYGGQATMEKIALMSRLSNIVNEMTAGALQVWGQDNLGGALEFLGQNPHFENTWAATELARDQTMHGDPIEVIEYFTAFEGNSELKGAMLSSSYENWVANSPEAFAEYVNTLDEKKAGPASTAMQVYALQVASESPEAALEWAESISDKGLREGAIVSVASQMATDHPQQFAEWFKTQKFESERERRDFAESVAEIVRINQNYKETEFDAEKWFNEMVEFSKKHDRGRTSE